MKKKGGDNMKRVAYKKRSKVFSFKGKTYLSVIPKPLVDMLNIEEKDYLMWNYDGRKITIDVIKNAVAEESN